MRSFHLDGKKDFRVQNQLSHDTISNEQTNKQTYNYILHGY